jgi:hypothetical protein
MFSALCIPVVHLIQCAGTECDYIQISVLVNRVKYNTHTKLRSIGSKVPFHIRLYLLKLHRLGAVAGVQYIPVIVKGINTNYSLHPTLQYVGDS